MITVKSVGCCMENLQKLDTMSCECPTEILVDIKEDECQCSHINRKEIKTFNCVESETKIESYSSAASSKSFPKDETILDISPSRTFKEFSVEEQMESQENLKQNMKYEISDGCPTAILINVSPPTDFCLKDNGVSNCNQNFKKSELDNLKVTSTENEDLKEKLGKSNYMNKGKSSDNQNSADPSKVESQILHKRLRWNTPSPQSMSRISKEASKIIDHLNSSSVFDEDILLTEEILPVTLNFDELEEDDDDTDKKNSVDTFDEDRIFNQNSLVHEESLNKAVQKDQTLSSHSSSNCTLENVQNNLKETFKETCIVKESFEISCKNDINSKESYSSGIHSNSLENSGSSSNCDEVDDVFNATHIAFEDKENIQTKINKMSFIKNNTKGNKISTKNLSLNKPNLGERGTLRNLSNIRQNASAQRLSISVNKCVTTPLKRMSISGYTKGNLYEKPQEKKAALLVESQHSLKSFSQIKTFAFQNTKEMTSSAKKSRPTANIDSGCSSLSSDMKQQNMFATPLKRYSISTPLKSASAVKPPLTPALNSAHNFAFPRFTPQPARPSRLSFSRSWQPSGNPQYVTAKELKQKISSAVPSYMPKISSGMRNSPKLGKISFSQSMSSASTKTSVKNITKERFSSKIHSPSFMEQDKKVARALFRNISK